MGALTEPPDVEAIASAVLASLAAHRQIPTFSSRPGGLTLAQAYRVTPLLRAAFEARGEKITGRKIGFTNRENVEGVRSPVADLGLRHEPDHIRTCIYQGHVRQEFHGASHRAGNHVRPQSGAVTGHERSRAARLHRMVISRLRDCAVDLSWLEIRGGRYGRCERRPRRTDHRTTLCNCAAQDTVGKRTGQLRC